MDNSGGSTVNSITADRHCGLGNAGVYSDNLVEVEKVAVERFAAVERTTPESDHVG